MDKNAGLNLCIDKDWNIVIDVRAGNRIRHKVITPDMFCQLVAKNVKVKGVTSGILPEGCVAFSEKGWYYGDRSKYPAYEELYEQVDNILAKHPRLDLCLAHFFFLSENPERLEKMFEK